MQFFAPGWKFVVTAVAIRIVHATGNAMVIVATFSYSAVEFQENVATIFVSTNCSSITFQLPSFFGTKSQNSVLNFDLSLRAKNWLLSKN